MSRLLSFRSRLSFAAVALFFFACLCSAQTAPAAFTITTVAGGGNPPYPSVGDGGPATKAFLSAPKGLTTDGAGSLYVAESRVRKVNSAGIISTLANVNSSGVASDNSGNIYAAVLSSGGSVIKIATDGTVKTVATLPAGSFGGPDGIAADNSGNVWFSWRGASGHAVSKMDSSGAVSLVVGGGAYSASLGDGGPATKAYLNEPRGIAVDGSGNLYIADFGNNRIRKVSPSGAITSIAGNSGSTHSGDGGSALQAGLAGPCGVALDSAGNLFLTEFYGNTVRMIGSNGTITTIAGTGSFGSSGDNGPASLAAVGSPYGIATASGGFIYVSTEDGLVRLLMPPIPPPSVTAGGIGPVFSSATTIQPGEWISIYGTNLATGTFTWNGDFPISLGGTSVTINGKPAYLWFASPGQINLQAPDDTATGSVPVVVKTASGSFTSSVTLSQYGPSWNLLDGKHVTGIILRSDGSGAYGGGSYDIVGPTGTSLGYRTVAAKAGDVIELFGVGFGPTTQSIPAGKAYSGAADIVASSGLKLLINNVPVMPIFAGLSGAGLFQFNIVVPAGLGSGDVALQATVGGVQTPAGVVISLQ